MPFIVIGNVLFWGGLGLFTVKAISDISSFLH